MMMKTLIAATVLIVSAAGIVLAQDVEKGAIVFKKMRDLPQDRPWR